MADEKTQKRKRFSKNKKKYWKKHADVKDVEEYLEDQRLQERTGGLVAEKEDDQLFFVERVTKPEEEEVPRKKRKRETKPLKCHSSLQSDPKIKPVTIAHNVKREKLKKKDLEPVKMTKTLREKLAMREAAIERRSSRLKEKLVPDADCDLWGKVETETAANNHYLRVMKKLPKKPPPKFFEKPSGLPAVEVIHPGASYNPTFEDHQELLTTALETEVKKEKEANRLKRALDEAFPDKATAPTEEDRQEELAEGLFDESESESSSEEEEDEGLSLNPPVRREDKKTEKQRNKEKKIKEELSQARQDKQDRIKKSEMFRIKTVKKEVKSLLEKQDSRRKRKEERAAANKDQPKRLGQNKFEAPDLEVKLSDEIQGSLRLLKPEGHLLEDRFKSLQKRNIIEPRGRAKVKRKYKRKKFEKKSHKNFV